MGFLSTLFAFFHSHFFVTLPVPTKSFAGQTIIVTGSNTGLGLEAARHLVRLDAAKVILAVRSIERGNAAKSAIEGSTGRKGFVEVWELDLARYASVKAFAERADKTLERLDVVIENAGVLTQKWSMAEDNEITITVNVVSTFLLALLLLPKLRETSTRYAKDVVLTFTGSFVHWIALFPERKADRVLEETAKREKAWLWDRYNVSKLMETFVFREFSAKLSQSSKPGNIITSILNPGVVITDLNREVQRGILGIPRRIFMRVIGRTPEEGSRTLVHAAEGAPQTCGQYLDDCRVGEYSTFVNSKAGSDVQRRLWDELMEKFETLQPGISRNI
ncbi:putative short-chain dehydrogenase/reductase family protein [Pestalotiopsis sp. NC0098]|nr:putative short-chain dehydrogenase/reductase family protein [Pestalotiopsis sp. NC0098]